MQPGKMNENIKKLLFIFIDIFVRAHEVPAKRDKLSMRLFLTCPRAAGKASGDARPYDCG